MRSLFLMSALLCLVVSLLFAESLADKNGGDSPSDSSSNLVDSAESQAAEIKKLLPLPDDVGFVVGILDELVPPDFVPPSVAKGEAEAVIMTGSDRKRYHCTIPTSNDQPEDDALTDSDADSDSTADPSSTDVAGIAGKASDDPAPAVDLAPTKVNVKVVLRKHVDGACQVRSHGWWAYKVCPFGKVTQFHAENGKTTIEFNLGDWDEAQDENALSSAEDPQYTQVHRNGDDGRRTKLTFKCRRSLTGHALALGEMKEPKMHEYEIDVFTSHACRPGEESDEPPSGQAAQGANNAQKREPSKAELRKMSPAALLESLGEKCLFHNTGWWTYELCYGRHLRQFHVEQIPHGDPIAPDKPGEPTRQPVKTVETASFDLGKFPKDKLPPDRHAKQSFMDKFTEINQRMTVEETFASQWYDDGTKCDLTGKPRRTELRFYCSRRSSTNQNAHHIVGLKETSTCEYVVNVNTPLLCSHKLFAPKEKPIRSIVCRKIMDTKS